LLSKHVEIITLGDISLTLECPPFKTYRHVFYFRFSLYFVVVYALKLYGICWVKVLFDHFGFEVDTLGWINLDETHPLFMCLSIHAFYYFGCISFNIVVLTVLHHIWTALLVVYQLLIR